MASKAIVVINFRMIGLRVRGPLTFHGNWETRPQGAANLTFRSDASSALEVRARRFTPGGFFFAHKTAPSAGQICDIGDNVRYRTDSRARRCSISALQAIPFVGRVLCLGASFKINEFAR
jgi:hypothetical protein